ncbi:hypothetical protein K438DRAFT_1612338, partial [Mycena galopus ATCC 62051]
FKSTKGIVIPQKQRLFAIPVSTSMHLIWRLRNKHRFETLDKTVTLTEIHNRWVAAINLALKCDCLFIGRLVLNRQTVLKTWSGTLWDEDSLLEDWIQSDRVLVGIWPLGTKIGVG